MSKNYQKKAAPVGTDAELVLPEAAGSGDNTKDRPHRR
jgi:hypothetical protein